MAKQKVVKWGPAVPKQSVTVEDRATIGATVGVDLYWLDGTVVQEEELGGSGGTSIVESGNVSGGVVTPLSLLWEWILNIPSNISALAALTTNPAKWLTTKDTVASGETVNIQTGYQLLIYGALTIDAGGVVNADGALVIL